MEIFSEGLQQALTVFTYIAAFMLIVIVVILAKVLLDICSIFGSVQKLLELLNYEFTPTINEIQNILSNISSMSDIADEQAHNINNTINEASTTTTNVVYKAKNGLIKLLTVMQKSFKKFIEE